MSDFKTAYQRTNYWLNYIANQLKKLRPAQPKKPEPTADNEDLVKEVQALREEIKALREQSGRDTGDHLDPADFDEQGLRYQNEHLDSQGRLSFEVQHYPTGRALGQVRTDAQGNWESMSYTQDGEPIWQELPEDWTEPEGGGTRDLAGAHLAATHAGALEARLIHQGAEVDSSTGYELAELHNAENALYHGVAVERVNQYLKDHKDKDFQGNENSVHVDVVPGSTVWNVSPARMRVEIMEDSPWALQQTTPARQTNHPAEVDPVRQTATEQVNQQINQPRQPTPEGANR